MRETKQERFIRVAEARVNKILKMLHLLGNCSQRSIYQYSEAQVEQIASTLRDAVEQTRHRFVTAHNRRFSLSDQTEDNQTKQRIAFVLPDGRTLCAESYPNDDYPSINICLTTGEDGTQETLCFAEFNQEREGAICVGVYQPDQEDTVYYEPYENGGKE